MEATFEKKEDHLYARAVGLYVEEEGIPVFLKISEICKKEKYSKVLIDVLDLDLSNITVTDRFKIGEKSAQIFKAPPHVRVAFLIKPEFYDGFGEIVAHNRGAWLRGFDNKDEALQALRR